MALLLKKKKRIRIKHYYCFLFNAFISKHFLLDMGVGCTFFSSIETQLHFEDERGHPGVSSHSVMVYKSYMRGTIGACNNDNKAVEKNIYRVLYYKRPCERVVERQDGEPMGSVF